MPSEPQPVVSLSDDAAIPSPAEMAVRLQELTRGQAVEADYYGNGGAVARMEGRIAKLLGKERAVMFPTGTLANLLAMRLLAGTGGGRVIVHGASHFFNDSGENLSLQCGLTMVPLADRGAGFSAEAVVAEIERARDARVASAVRCIAIESPSRRLYGARFPPADLDAVAAVAKANTIPLFMDGARMLIEAAYVDRDPADIAAPFDIVYLSLYKYLGAPFGCVLAGRAAVLDGVFHERRRFGGSLYQMWPAALLAENGLSGFAEKWAETIPVSKAVLGQVEATSGVTVERIDRGTNVAILHRPGQAFDPEELKRRGSALGLKLPAPAGDTLPVKVNESWLRLEPADLAKRILEALRP